MILGRDIVEGVHNNMNIAKEKAAEIAGRNNKEKEGIELADLAQAILAIRAPHREMRAGDILNIKSELSNAEVEIKFLYVGRYRDESE